MLIRVEPDLSRRLRQLTLDEDTTLQTPRRRRLRAVALDAWALRVPMGPLGTLGYRN